MIAPFSGHVPAEAVVPPVRRPLVAIAQALVALAAVAGTVIDLILGSPLQVLSYFTIQSNLLLAIVFGASAWRAWQGRPPLPAWMTAGATLFIAITGLVYHLVLANSSSGFSMTGEVTLTGWRVVSNDLLHSVTPLGAALVWLLLVRPGGLRLGHAGWWMLYPLAYFCFALVRGAIMSPGSTARYPYPFLDVDQHGYLGVLGNGVVFGLLFYALALAIVGLDRIRPDLGGRGNRISSPGDGPLK
ncbi:Pr6Pr family membrane protein [Streptomyces sp. NBC_01304]|uniref:Pr6Pr family membrane protein n=1 Tax=Streptomyces sp. NBC_01304 TaxID=2903818 RepID=UPI002E0ED04E|nr:Pr6Pr family membrane protein [Streptomyces sp. NBC_01304]